jgi:hypothetical protein
VLLGTVVKMPSLPACKQVLLLKEIVLATEKPHEIFKGKLDDTLYSYGIGYETKCHRDCKVCERCEI